MPDAPAAAPEQSSPPSTGAVVTSDRRRARRRGIRLLLLYGLVMGLIAFWPVPVDRGASGLLGEITRAVPWLTYDVIETVANVLLFVPLGVLLALVLPLHRGLVLPIALATTVVIESGQALFLSARTPALRDIAANMLGGAIGLAIVLLAERRARTGRARR
jgi:hypothetical protein